MTKGGPRPFDTMAPTGSVGPTGDVGTRPDPRLATIGTRPDPRLATIGGKPLKHEDHDLQPEYSLTELTWLY
ncbi:hypothetical protein [Streptomyces sp. NPDC057582]|uniref:hypothetical protein n=1 Tax=unclassified Streptomyces TaxID=2593676 RepID=UPI003684B389